MHRRILGLDISTKTIGLSIAEISEDNNINLLQVTHLRPKISAKIKGIETLFLKSNIFTNELYKYKDYNISDVVIEEPLISSNNQETVATLLRFNGMIAQSVYTILGIIPEFISSYDARKYGCPEIISIRKYNKKGEIFPYKKILSCIKKNEVVLFGSYPFDCAKKFILWNIVSERFPNIKWVYNKNNELMNENFDASDSLICILGFINKEKYHETNPKIENMSIEENEKLMIINYNLIFCGNTYNKKLEIPKLI